MYRLEREEFVKKRFILLWAILGFQAGFINAFGFLACGRYVSHVTGFGTQIGVALANQNPAFALELLGFPASFIMGSFFSATLTAARIEQDKRPHFDVVVTVLPIILAGLTMVGLSGLFGLFGEELLQMHDFVLLFLLSFACGMQNGCFATLTRGLIRTTHLTGISTDIGTDLARMWFGGISGHELALTRQINYARLITLLAFTIGSVLSVLTSSRLEYTALIAPLLTSILVRFYFKIPRLCF